MKLFVIKVRNLKLGVLQSLNNINFTLYYVLCFHKISGQTVRKQIRQQFHIWSCILCKYRFHERMFIFDKLISNFNEIRDRVT